MKKILTLFLFCASILLVGCTRMSTQTNVIENVKKSIPNSKFEKIQQVNDEENIYIFKNQEFTFEVTNRLLSSAGLPKSNSYENNYYEKLYEYKKEDIKKIVAKYNIKEYDSNNINTNEITYKFETSCGSNNINFYINNFNDISTIHSFLEEIYIELEEYFLISTNNTINDKILVDIYCNKKEIKNPIYYTNSPFSKTKFNYNDWCIWSAYLYANEVLNGNINEPTLDISNMKPYIINQLYINNVPYTSEQYEIEFIYNLEDDTYYTIVCYGHKFSTNGGVADYLQREIIQKYYKNPNYVINNSLKTTKYNINGNTYKIVWEKDKNYKYEKCMVFYKNNKNMKITPLEKIGYKTPNAAYNQFISIDDFAKLIEMEIEKIDIQNGIIYMKTID